METSSPRVAGRVLWLVFLLVGMAGAVGHLFLLDTARGIVYLLIGMSSAALVLVAAIRYRARPRWGWAWLGLAVLAANLGDLIWALAYLDGTEPPFPGPQDVLYMLAFGAQFAGLILITRAAGGRDRESLLDATTAAVAATLVAWVFWVDPMMHQAQSIDVAAAAYPILDLILLGLLVRLMLGVRRFTPALTLAAVAVILNLVGDAAYMGVRLTSDFDAGGFLDITWLSAYVFFAAAALHPSARSLAEAGRQRNTIPRTRLVLLLSAALTGPSLILHQYAAGHVDLPIMVTGTVGLFVLVIVRLNRVTITLGRAVDEEAERFEALISNSTDAITIVDGGGLITYSSPSFATVWGREPRDVTGRYFLDLLPGHDRDGVAAKLDDARRRTEAVTFEVRADHADGTVRWLEMTAQDLSGESVIDGLVVNQRDVTERKRTQEELQQRETVFKTVVEKVPAIVYLAEAGVDRGWIYLSPQIESVLGYKPEEWMASQGLWYERLHPDDRERAVREEERSWHEASGERYQSEYRFIARDGRTVWLSDEWSVVKDEDGIPAFFSGVLLDITEAKRLEDQMRQKQKMEAVGSLAGGIAHDFNNLLAVIQNCARFASEEIGRDHPAQQDLSDVIEAGYKAGRLTRQLLAFSRQEIVRPEVLDLRPTLEGMEKLLRRTIRENIDLEVSSSPEPLLTMADPGQIEQLVMNLAVNAQDAMPRGGDLRIEMAAIVVDPGFADRHPGMRTGSYLRLRVADTGTGMSKEVRERIFEPFFTTKERGAGTGLGLATVYGIVKRLDGYIAVDSEVNKGTIFDIYLLPTEPALEEGPSEEAIASEILGDETVLVVEDDDTVRGVVTRILERKGFQVLEASLGSEALEIYRSNADVDVVLTDVIMPGMSGRELADRLQLDDPDLKIVFMSGYTDDVIAEEGLLLDKEISLVQKPFRSEALVGVLREALDRV